MLGVIAGVCTLYAVWLAIGAFGVIGGFFLGSFIYELTLMQFDFFHAWGFMSITVGCVILGIILSCKYGKEVIVICSSQIGAILVVRGTSLFFEEGFPTESEII